MKNKNKNITTKFRKSKSGGKSGVVSALDYTRLLPSVQYVKNESCSATGVNAQILSVFLYLALPLVETLPWN